MHIRLAQESDYQKIYELVQTAFLTAQVSDGTEQDFVLKLRKGNTFIPQLEFVAEDNNELIGHIMMTKQNIQTQNGILTGVLVAPLCVKKEYRNQGIGRALITHAHQCARQLGYQAAFLVGDPLYYHRFQYFQTNKFNIKNNSEIPDQYVLACELNHDALKNIVGEINIVE